ncbi:MAG TPA: bifunctional 2-polyprenyl-6-hydroxyphenol methylase/3-demethylubiquinol 3-O-methyltransferase UbiG [Roseiarcus sp.]|nr:bifunctional 2-polyprenyl-6-hydroxyphenol methylase/3-demethylubiquinol 3-O-methyltransferase UbiG [Roseiarcus sp.]
MNAADAPSIDPDDVARFEALGEDWWDPAGSMRALHRINPLRLGWIRDLLIRRFGPAGADAPGPLAGLAILDIGCGAGLLSEPLARLGAEATGIDPAPGNIEIARRHAEETGADVLYRAASLEEVAAEGKLFDAVLAMEVVEHVRDMRGFVKMACGLVKPGGLFAASTLNRTFRSFALAIIGAEYVLGWVPKGAHRWEQFVTPDELREACRAAGCREIARTGMIYDPLQRRWRLSRDASVNYMMAARKSEAAAT